ncbi:polysaccharide pyruvyl transferase family protein [Demequina sp.]|uniref:polysaccharide pyruvyl transferase family protein n=1 Tax=Demequina sp. TaxID=2050685 RepID=UPI003A841F20
MRWLERRGSADATPRNRAHRERAAIPGHRVLAVGAYERDNFGDLLFLEVTEALCAGASVTASSVIAADMTREFGRAITTYAHELRAHTFDVVWSVGGELGRVNTSAALKYSLPPAAFASLTSLDETARRPLVEQLTGMPHQDLVYVPDLTQFSLNSGARQVIHSAGLSGISTLRPEQQERIVARLSRAASITVRDNESGAVLAERGITADVSPDVVHALPLLFPHVLEDRHDSICFHAAATCMQRAGTERVGEALAALAAAADTDVLLFVAGTAFGHDSVERYQEVVRYLAAKHPRVGVRISGSRDPMDLAKEVAGSRIWIGTSLHGRIIAASAGVPRVSLSKAIDRPDPAEKTARYSRTWDGEMPYATPLNDVVNAYTAAVAEETSARGVETGRDLALQALVTGRRAAGRALPLRG